MLELKGYITNLGKYNEGELIGEWITFPIDEDDFNEVMERIGCYYIDASGVPHNEEYEEFFFTDWECEADLDLGEYESIDDLNELAEKIEEWDEELLKAACEIWNIDEVIDNDPDDYYLLNDVNNDYDLGYYWIEESGCYNLSSMGNLANYFDYEAFGRDVNMESNGGFTTYGYVEYRG